jgi:hypothetical protein
MKPNQVAEQSEKVVSDDDLSHAPLEKLMQHVMVQRIQSFIQEDSVAT